MNSWSFDFQWAFVLLPFLLYCLYRCKKTPPAQIFPHLHFFGTVTRWRTLQWMLTVLVVILMVMALATPITINYDDPRNRHGIDIVLALDGSGSMNASGFSQDNPRESRFESVQTIARDFSRKRIQDNIGVVMFGDFAFIASPITYEKEIISEMIGYLNEGMAGQNTAIGEGIAMGVRALRDSKAHTKVIILLTDGEHNSGAVSPKEAMGMVTRKHIKLYTIGIGEKGEFDSPLLETLAREGGGRFFAASNEKELQTIYETIDTLERSPLKSDHHTLKEHYYHWFGAEALGILLFMAWQRRKGIQ